MVSVDWEEREVSLFQNIPLNIFLCTCGSLIFSKMSTNETTFNHCIFSNNVSNGQEIDFKNETLNVDSLNDLSQTLPHHCLFEFWTWTFFDELFNYWAVSPGSWSPIKIMPDRHRQPTVAKAAAAPPRSTASPSPSSRWSSAPAPPPCRARTTRNPRRAPMMMIIKVRISSTAADTLTCPLRGSWRTTATVTDHGATPPPSTAWVWPAAVHRPNTCRWPRAGSCRWAVPTRERGICIRSGGWVWAGFRRLRAGVERGNRRPRRRMIRRRAGRRTTCSIGCWFAARRMWAKRRWSINSCPVSTPTCMSTTRLVSFGGTEKCSCFSGENIRAELRLDHRSIGVLRRRGRRKFSEAQHVYLQI